MLRDQQYIQRTLIGFLFLMASGGWFFAIRAGNDLDDYWQQLNWTQRVLSVELQETNSRREVQNTIRALFESLETCDCAGDVGKQQELWKLFLAQLEREEELARQIDVLLKEQ